MKRFIYIFFAAVILFYSCAENSVDPLPNINGVPVMDILIDHYDYIALLSNKTTDYETYCKFSFEGKLYDAIISSSGAGSRYTDKWSYKIELLNEQTINGLNEFRLSSQTFDQSGMHNVIASYVYRKLGFPVFKSRHVFVKVNGKDQGLYPMIERVEDDFFESRNLKAAELFKLGFDSKFTFQETNNVQFFFEKKIPDDNNFNSLIEFIHAVDTSSSAALKNSLGGFLDIQNYLKYHAATSLINNIDGFTNNFFLWKEYPHSPFKIIPWDFDKAFSGNASGALAGFNQIAAKLFSNENILNDYKNLLVYYNEKLLNEAELFPIIDSTAVVIRDAYKRDPYLGKAGYNLDDEIQKLKNYILRRNKFIKENADAFKGF
jgi:spore coat protein H